MAFFRSGGFRILLGAVVLLTLVAGVGALYFYRDLTRDLPDLTGIEDYRPPLVSEVLDRNGHLVAEFSTERRRLAPIDEIPDHVKRAFVAAEDGSFFEHPGIDVSSIARAAWANFRAGGEIKQGASTITQQMVKSLLLSPERTYRRKLREAILALRIEQSFSKDEILYLYVNQIYFGNGAWGIAEAARSYFWKEVKDLTISEAALLAGLPQRPSEYSPFRSPEAAESRRRYVLGRMLADGIIDQSEYDVALASPPVLAEPDLREDFAVSAYFTEQVRRQLFDVLGGDLVLEGGLRIETTMDLDLQRVAVEAVQAGLRAQDKRAGYRGPLRRVAPDAIEALLPELAVENDLEEPEPSEEALDVEVAGEDIDGALVEGAEVASTGPVPEDAAAAETDEADALEEALARPELPLDRPLLGVVTGVDEDAQQATVAFAPDREGIVHLEDVTWARKPNPKRRSRPVKEIASIFAVGDVVRFERLAKSARPVDEETKEKQAEEGEEAEEPLLPFGIFQEPESQAGLLSMEVATGNVIAIVGGYDYAKSQYNRATQALRQPGSAFKPLIYAAALGQGYTPVSTLYDRPIVYTDPVTGFKYKPQNYERRFFGPVPMRYALAHSINNATVHLFRDVGVDYVIDYARRLGIDAPLSRDLSLAIGSSSVTLLELTKAYAVFPNHGRRVEPRFITRVTDREGNVLLEDVILGSQPDELAVAAEGPDDDAWVNGDTGAGIDVAGDDGIEPLRDGVLTEGEEIAGAEEAAEQVIPEPVAYLMCDLMKAVVNEGTGRRLKSLGGYLAGKTGTTNEFVDAWYMGFSSELTTGVWVGHDQRQRLGAGESGAVAALPIWRDFMKQALASYPVKDFDVPEKIVFRSIDRETGLLAGANTRDAYFQPFLEDTAPTETAGQASSASDAHSRVRDDAF